MTLDELLQEVTVGDVDEHHRALNELPGNMIGWYYVVDEEGIRGYFPGERDALHFRLALINARLNNLAIVEAPKPALKPELIVGPDGWKARPERSGASPVPHRRSGHTHEDCQADCGAQTFEGPVCRVCLCCRACARAYAYQGDDPCPGCKLNPEAEG